MKVGVIAMLYPQDGVSLDQANAAIEELLARAEALGLRYATPQEMTVLNEIMSAGIAARGGHAAVFDHDGVEVDPRTLL